MKDRILYLLNKHMRAQSINVNDPPFDPDGFATDLAMSMQFEVEALFGKVVAEIVARENKKTNNL